MKKEKYISPLLGTLTIGIMCVVLVISLILPDRSFSEVENRPLSTLPKPDFQTLEDGSYGKSFNAWFDDQFPGRNVLFHVNYLLRKWCGQREINDVFLGRHALLANPDAVRGDTLKANGRAIDNFSRSTDMACYLLIAPGAASIQTEKLPKDAPVQDINPSLDELYASMPNVSVVDIREMMKEHASEYIYYRTDHHWTTYGAGLAAQQLLAAGNIGIDLNTFDQMAVSGDFEGTLAAKTGSIGLEDVVSIAVSQNNPEYVVTWADGTKTASIYNKDALSQRDEYQLFLGQNQSMIRIDTANETERTLLLFKDSYANSMVQYLLPYYRSITIIDPRYYSDDLDLVLSSGEYTDAAFVYSYDTFATISSLQDVLSTVDSAGLPSE